MKRTIKFYTKEEDAIILNNKPEDAVAMLSGRTMQSIYQRKLYLNKKSVGSTKKTKTKGSYTKVNVADYISKGEKKVASTSSTTLNINGVAVSIDKVSNTINIKF